MEEKSRLVKIWKLILIQPTAFITDYGVIIQDAGREPLF